MAEIVKALEPTGFRFRFVGTVLPLIMNASLARNAHTFGATTLAI
jgi:hypothetical protein